MVVNKMGIQHNHYADPTNKVGCDQWNDEHKIVNMLGYELVEEKILPAGTTSCVFDGLNGDVDEEYLIEYEIVTNPTNSISYTSVYINATSGLTIKATGHIVHSSAGGHGIDNLAKATLGRNSWTHSHIFKGECKIQKLNSNYATIIGTAVCIANDYWSRWDYSSTTALSSSINSLIIIPDNGSFSGKIRLWKKIPVNGGG